VTISGLSPNVNKLAAIYLVPTNIYVSPHFNERVGLSLRVLNILISKPVCYFTLSWLWDSKDGADEFFVVSERTAIASLQQNAS